MKKQRLGSTKAVAMMTVLLSLAGGSALAGERGPMTPELASKREMVRQQQEQRVTPEKRKAAAQALKAERLKVLKARKAANLPTPVTIDDK